MVINIHLRTFSVCVCVSVSVCVCVWVCGCVVEWVGVGGWVVIKNQKISHFL